MTEKQKRFADEYLIDCNATRAYKAAYPAVKKDSVAAVSGSQLLRNPKVRDYLDEKLAEIHSRKTADAQEVLEYLTSVMRGESEAEVVVTEFFGDGCSEAKRMRKNPDEKERLRAAELLGKRHGLFKDAVTVDLEPVVITDDLKE